MLRPRPARLSDDLATLPGMGLDDAINQARRTADWHAEVQRQHRAQAARERAELQELRQEAVERLLALPSEALIRVEPAKWYKFSGDRFVDPSGCYYRAVSEHRCWVLRDIQSNDGKNNFVPTPVLLLDDSTLGQVQVGPELTRVTPLPADRSGRREFVSPHPLATDTKLSSLALDRRNNESTVDLFKRMLAEAIVRYERANQ